MSQNSLGPRVKNTQPLMSTAAWMDPGPILMGNIHVPTSPWHPGITSPRPHIPTASRPHGTPESHPHGITATCSRTGPSGVTRLGNLRP